MPTPRKHTNQAQRQRAYIQRQKAAQIAVLAAKNMPAASAIPTMPSQARWKALQQQAQIALETLQAEMEDYRDERSDQWQEGEKGEAFQDTLNRIAEALQAIQDIS
jgi:hypothetical protein